MPAVEARGLSQVVLGMELKLNLTPYSSRRVLSCLGGLKEMCKSSGLWGEAAGEERLLRKDGAD